MAQEKRSLVKELIELGKQKGQLTNQDILDAIGEQDFDPEKLEKLYDMIESQGIEIIEDFDGTRTVCLWLVSRASPLTTPSRSI